MISTGFIVLGAYGTYQSFIAFERIKEKKRKMPIYRYQGQSSDFLQYIQQKHQEKPFLLHLDPTEIDPTLRIGMIKILAPKFHFDLQNLIGSSKSFSVTSDNYQTAATIPLTPTFGLQVKNQWVEAFTKSLHCNANKPNIIIPAKGFKMLFPEKEVDEATMMGEIPLMEEEYFQLTGEKQRLSPFSNNSHQIMLERKLFDTNIRGLYYFGQLEPAVSNSGYQNAPLSSSDSQSTATTNEKAVVSPSPMTKFLASHISTDKAALLDEVFKEEDENYSMLLGCSIGIMIGGAIVATMK